MNHAVSWPEAAEDIVFCLCLFSILAFIFWAVMRDDKPHEASNAKPPEPKPDHGTQVYFAPCKIREGGEGAIRDVDSEAERDALWWWDAAKYWKEGGVR